MVAFFVILLTFWLITSGSFSFQHIFIGGLISLSVSAVYTRMFKKYQISGIKISKPYILLNYLFHLVIDIVRANINVAKIVLSPRMPISPGMVKYRTKVKSDVGKVMLATSITLTPGTLTVDVEGDEFLVHVLTEENALGLTDWGIEEKIMKMEG